MDGAQQQSVCRVLLVEDNPGDAALINIALTEARGLIFELRHAMTLGHTRDVLGAESFDVILLDLSLSDAHGLTVVGEVQGLAPGTPIVVLSGSADEQLAVEAVKLGAQDYLVKGEVDSGDLIRSIRYAIERKQSEQELARLAHYDTLTGLPNRTLFMRRLDRAIARAQRSGIDMALLFIDLDRFKQVNDTLGHAAGDELLRQVAKRLSGCVREVDSVARLGGDEFTVIIEGVHDLGDAAMVASKLLVCMQRPFLIGDVEVSASPSIGIAVYPRAGVDGEDLLCKADAAMYRAKQSGRANYQFHIGNSATELTALDDSLALRRAVERGEFELYYQPRLSLVTGKMSGVEALLRWHQPGRGAPVLPNEFLPMAEASGLARALGEWVLREASQAVLKWRARGHRGLSLTVNLSAPQLAFLGDSGRLERIIGESGLEADALELDVTEETLLDRRSARCLLGLKRLRDIGVHVSIDDFGTGYSSLARLRGLPIDIIKLDVSFIAGIGHDRVAEDTVQALITLGHALGKRVFAEGVETRAQLDFLRRAGCDEIQGYAYCHPLPEPDLLSFIIGARRAAG